MAWLRTRKQRRSRSRRGDKDLWTAELRFLGRIEKEGRSLVFLFSEKNLMSDNVAFGMGFRFGNFTESILGKENGKKAWILSCGR